MTVLVVAVSYNGSRDFATLARSLESGTSTDWRCIVANNSPAPGEAAALNAIAGEVPRITHQLMGDNLGYFGAAHAVARLEDLSTYMWIVIANTDLRFAADFIERLNAFAPEGLGCLAPSVIDEATGRNENPYMVTAPTRQLLRRRRLLMLSPAFAQATFLLKSVAETLRLLNSRSAETPPGRSIFAPHGSVVILSRDFFARGGSLQSPLFLFGEENLVGAECARLELPVVFRPELRVRHSAHAQTGRLRSRHVLRHMVAAAKHLHRESRARAG